MICLPVLSALLALAWMATDVTGSGDRSVCYYTNWAQYRKGVAKFLPGNIEADLCTHIIYAFAKIEGSKLATFEWNDVSDGWSKGMYKEVMKLKAKNPALKVLIAAGGWNLGTAPWSANVATKEKRELFAKNIVEFVRKHEFDGWDSDWEYPGKRGSPAEDKQNNVLFMEEVRRAMDADAKATGRPRLLLTFAIGVGRDTVETSYDLQALSRSVDWFNAMTYDLHGGWDAKTGHNAPLYAHPSEKDYQACLNVDWATRNLVAKGVPKDKVVVGIPTYGRSFILKDKTNTGRGVPAVTGRKSAYIGEKGFVPYFEVCEMIKNGGQVHEIEEQRVRYFVKGDQWVGYDDVKSVKAKACYAKQQGYGGVMFWTLDFDDFTGSMCGQGKYPLIKAATRAFRAGSCSGKTTGTTESTRISEKIGTSKEPETTEKSLNSKKPETTEETRTTEKTGTSHGKCRAKDPEDCAKLFTKDSCESIPLLDKDCPHLCGVC